MSFTAWPEIDHSALETERHRRFLALLVELGLDHAVLTNFDALRYAVGLRAGVVFGATKDWYAALVAAGGETVLVTIDVDSEDSTPFPAQPWVTRRVPGPSWQLFALQPNYFASVLVAEIRRAGARRVGVDELQFEIMDYLRIELPDVEFVPIKRELTRVRAVKMPEEIALLEAASAAGSHCMATAINGTEPGMRDHEVVSLAVGEAFRIGAEWTSHQVLVAEGLARNDTWFPRGKRLARGDSYIFDFGLYGPGGYANDFCRSHFVGNEPPKEVADAHRVLLESFAEGVAAARPGVRASSIHTTINAALVRRGLPPTPYAMGHGIGLCVCEYPAITWPGGAEHDDLLEEGMVLCIEPSTHVDTRNVTVALKEEDVFVVESGGLRAITTTPRATAD